jgi:hypothetical protein
VNFGGCGTPAHHPPSAKRGSENSGGEGGGAFQLLEYRWPRWSSRGVNFLNRSHPQRKETFECAKEFSFEITIFLFFYILGGGG